MIYIKDKGIVLDEPSYIALDTRTSELIAIGKEAYEMVLETRPDVLLTDIIMPFIDGLALINKINNTKTIAAPDIPLLHIEIILLFFCSHYSMEIL